MGKADYYADGEWNFFCDFCGCKNKSGDAMKTWNGFYVCKHHKEVRNPQDFIRGVKDVQAVPWTRPEALPESFVGSCTLQGRNAIPGFAIPGCAIPSYINLAFLPSLVMYSGWAICDTSGDPIQGTDDTTLYPPGTPIPPQQVN